MELRGVAGIVESAFVPLSETVGGTLLTVISAVLVTVGRELDRSVAGTSELDAGGLLTIVISKEVSGLKTVTTTSVSAAVDRGEGIGCGDTGDVSVVATGSPALVVKDI